jgi:hypothetical protein
VLVLNRHAGRKHPEDIPQDAQFGFNALSSLACVAAA